MKILFFSRIKKEKPLLKEAFSRIDGGL